MGQIASLVSEEVLPTDSQLAELPSDVLALQFLSEVATIEFVRKHTSIPAPEILHSDFNPNNAVGTPFMLMQRIPGESLGTAWHSMSREQREGVVREVAHVEAQLLQAPLSMIGNLIDDDGTVGPLAPSSTYPETLRDPHRGPFPSSKSLLEAHLRCELLLIRDCNQWTLQRTKWRNLNGGVADMPFAYAILWFSLLLAAIHAVPSEEFNEPAHFTLYHDDLTLNNILVSPAGTVVGLVDWQGSRVRPLWDATRNTHFLQDENLFDDPVEWNALLEIQQDVIFAETGFHPGSSPLRLVDLFHIVNYSHSVCSSRAHMDGIFLQWFENVASFGYKEWLEPFLPLKLFIEAQRPSARG
ncbi:hypothetical protein C8F01DRAFT_5439 [Mycena amicta]|nr:hypothetical protein C8F01DRAFT_5439 [Mycena amicta]